MGEEAKQKVDVINKNMASNEYFIFFIYNNLRRIYNNWAILFQFKSLQDYLKKITLPEILPF
jgi:hypothetical protein